MNSVLNINSVSKDALKSLTPLNKYFAELVKFLKVVLTQQRLGHFPSSPSFSPPKLFSSLCFPALQERAGVSPVMQWKHSRVVCSTIHQRRRAAEKPNNSKLNRTKKHCHPHLKFISLKISQESLLFQEIATTEHIRFGVMVTIYPIVPGSSP